MATKAIRQRNEIEGFSVFILQSIKIAFKDNKNQ